MYPPTAASPNVIFQSTLSMRRATRTGSDEDGQRRGISIHALHEESDNQMAQLNTIGSDFNPRSP